MPRFRYKAKDGPHRIVAGEIIAEHRAAALGRIEALGYSPVSVEEAAGNGRARPALRARVTSQDITTLTRQLAGLLKAGVPILRALATIEQQTESARLQRVVGDLLTRVRDGSMLSAALVRHPRLFPEVYVSMVRSGESGGVLDTILLRVADAREKEDELKSKVRSALAYPSLIMAVGVVSVVLILTLFLPRIAALFTGSNHPLPLPTRVVLAISHGVTATWPWLLGLAILLGLAARQAWSRARSRIVLDRCALRIPWLGRFLRDADLVRVTDTMALLLQAGVSIERSIPLAANTMQNTVLRDAIEGVGRDTVLTGSSLADGLQRRPQIPPFATNMVAVGEESGRLDEALTEVSAFYRRELDRDLRWVTTMLEPVLILVVGAIMGFIIFAMLLPIFELGRTLG